MTPEEYEAKVMARLHRLQARAAKARSEAESLESRAHRMGDVIPMGQPILVGHYSEGRDRRYRERIRNTYQRAYERGKEAADLGRRAKAAEDNDAISSDDPRAVEKLRAKLVDLERLQERDKAINAVVRSYRRALTKPHDAEKLRASAAAALGALGLKPEGRLVRDLLDEPDCSGRFGIPSYCSTNRAANMRRIRERIAILERSAASPERAPEEHGPVTLSEDRDANRVQLRFPGKPSRETIAELKSHGFRWSPTAGVWQRQANNAAWHAGQQIARRFGEKAEAAE